jgi:hypothetical protein
MTPYDVQRRELARQAKDSFPELNLYSWTCRKCKQKRFGTGGRKKLRGEGWACKDCA